MVFYLPNHNIIKLSTYLIQFVKSGLSIQEELLLKNSQSVTLLTFQALMSLLNELAS